MQLLATPDTHPDNPHKGHLFRIGVHLRAPFDALRRRLGQWAIPLRRATRRAGSQSLVRFRRDRISVGIDVGDIGLGRLEPADVGA